MSKRHHLSQSMVPPDARAGLSASAPRAQRLFWLCLGLGLLALSAVMGLFGLTVWTLLVAVIVIACPAIAAWVLLGGLDRFPAAPRS